MTIYIAELIQYSSIAFHGLDGIEVVESVPEMGHSNLSLASESYYGSLMQSGRFHYPTNKSKIRKDHQSFPIGERE